MTRYQRTLAIIYAVAFIVTFGHAWNMKQTYYPSADPMANFVASAVCAAGWPFYWSAWWWAHL